MTGISKKEADAHDRMLDAAMGIAELIEQSGIDIDDEALEALCIFLATHAVAVRRILGGVKPP